MYGAFYRPGILNVCFSCQVSKTILEIFLLLPMKSSQSFLGSKDGLKFWWSLTLVSSLGGLGPTLMHRTEPVNRNVIGFKNVKIIFVPWPDFDLQFLFIYNIFHIFLSLEVPCKLQMIKLIVLCPFKVLFTLMYFFCALHFSSTLNLWPNFVWGTSVNQVLTDLLYSEAFKRLVSSVTITFWGFLGLRLFKYWGCLDSYLSEKILCFFYF